VPKVTSKLIVGQNVVCRRTRKIGQLISVEEAEHRCTIRYMDSGEIATLQTQLVRIATWVEMRNRQAMDDLPTRIVTRSRSDIPE
jgi:hypothetical protein